MLKQTCFQHCFNHLNNNLLLFDQRKKEITLALEAESKSSAGDKHETGRAMVQLEREKLGEQIKATEKKLHILRSLVQHTPIEKATLGTVVKTTNHNYYIAIAAPELKIDNTVIYCISAQSPIGQLLLGKKVGETISFQHTLSEITAIL